MRRFAAVLILSAVPLSAQAGEGAYDAAFEILRRGQPIGFHVVDVEQTADGFVVDTRIEMKVKFGPIPVYRYEHVSHEVWRDGDVVSIDSRTNDNGDKHSVVAARENDILMIDATGFKGPAPEGAFPSSYWNKAITRTTTLLNTQTGELIDVTVLKKGVTQSPGGTPAEQFMLAGTVALNLWYNGDQWVGSNFVIDGEELTYRPVSSADERSRLYAQIE